MSHRYNLRNSRSKQNNPPKYRESDEEDKDESEEEVAQSPQQQNRRSAIDSDQTDDNDSSVRDYNSSALSTTASDSFSFDSGHSPSARRQEESAGRLYPSLPEPGGRPVSRRRDHHNQSPRLTAPSSSRRGSSGDRHYSEESAPSNQSRTRKRPKKAPDNNNASSWFKWVCIVIIILLLGYLIHNKIFDSRPLITKAKDSHFDMFAGKVDELKGKYAEQNERLWRVIKSCTRHVFDSQEVTYPAVLLMVSERGNAAQAAALAEDVGQRFESILSQQASLSKAASLNLTVLPGKVEASKQKLDLDNWLKQKLNVSHTAIILNHLEILSPEAALLLHGYCDNDNAPYKQVMLILGLYLEQPVDSPQAAELALKKMWMSKLSEDKVGALLSRVANNIALVTAPPK